jgi:DNA-binding response OmpR family regulator
MGASNRSGGARILIVDDDDDLRETLCDLFAHCGFDVEGAANGHEALALVGRAMPDVLVLDLEMPIMTGWEVLRALGDDVRGRRVPVIACSGVDPTRARVGGAVVDYFRKPLDIMALLARVRALVVSVGRASIATEMS